MWRVTDVNTNIDIGGLHVGSVVKEKGLVLDREVSITNDFHKWKSDFFGNPYIDPYINLPIIWVRIFLRTLTLRPFGNNLADRYMICHNFDLAKKLVSRDKIAKENLTDGSRRETKGELAPKFLNFIFLLYY